MASPSVQELPKAGARLSRPNTFSTDAEIFLSKLPVFRVQVNQLSSYLNSTINNKYNYGKLNGVRDFPTLFQFDEQDIDINNGSLDFTSKLDVLYNNVYEYSTHLNAVGDWFDRVVAESGTIPHDDQRPIVSGISQPMLKAEARNSFNTSSVLFNETVVNNINSLYQVVRYIHLVCCGDKDYGLITDTVTETVDFNPFEPPYNLGGIWNDTTQAVDLTWDFN